MQLSAETRLQIGPHVVTRVVDDTVAILNVRSGEYFSINEVGVLFMELAQAGQSLGQIAERVAVEYETTEEEALGDLVELATSLVEEGLVEVRESTE